MRTFNILIYEHLLSSSSFVSRTENWTS